MAKVIVIGSGFAGHTAALYLGDALGKKHEITVVNKLENFSYIPSWVWVGVDQMKPGKTVFPLAPVYKKKRINFVHAEVQTVYPEQKQIEALRRDGSDEIVRLDYDYLLIATGPHLNFAGTEGLGPHNNGNSHSICTLPHVIQTRDTYLQLVDEMKAGKSKRMVFGTGHPGATCQGAAFEYITNVHKDLLRRGIRDKAELVWVSNEADVGDFGVDGITVYRGKETLSSKEFISAVFDDYGIEYHVQKGVKKVDGKALYWEDYEGQDGGMDYDFAMLIPQFTGVKFNYVGQNGEDLYDKVANPAGFIKVDGKYGQSYDDMIKDPESWPAVYQNPDYPEIFAAGIAFAPPGPISRPHKNPNGMLIAAAPPRTGMVSGVIGRVVAKNIISMIQTGKLANQERMTEMVAACIASMGNSLWDGSAATMVLYPVVPDHSRFPDTKGRDPFVTDMEMGLSGAWMKRLIHSTMIHKAKSRPGWKIIPE
ncbi:MAG: FAD-dependent oxidoreductase [Leptospiraceae bacterium]|nr:FAD-dependent oxidoreductase [Leptospiraceae bacterium]